MDVPPAIEFAKECVSQMITLSTALLALSATFIKDLHPKVAAGDRRRIFGIWALLLLSVGCGLWTLAGITGSLATTAEIDPKVVYESNIRFPSIAQFSTFGLSLLAMMVHAVRKAFT